MFAILVTLVFVAAACLALGAIAISWKAYGPAMLAVRRQLADCQTRRDIRYTLIEMKVRSLPAEVRVRRPVLPARHPMRAAA